MIQYALITLDRRKVTLAPRLPYRFFLRVESVTEDFVVGVEVNEEGDEVLRHGAIQKHIISGDGIKNYEPMKMSLHYGTLEPE